ncbi:HK97 gp10 family phage protein [Aliihoeflea aestuarii]|uniref:HK97-gp10 family putative phage morphogenesis protein n=1 Tax=Aliihoeflea aestuarii TaxID=453840 RepID=UPI0020925C52|nr:HK97-gp10 family putative phage morphogenesis protein [Aliihoeflea aestuarii]MCO6390556.1 HK97 gp10 family phage protein [Aliihoeflea aestuarii]
MADDGGLRRLQKRLQDIPDEVVRAVQPALIRQAETIAGTMKSAAPRDTGDLIDSIAITPPDSSTPPYSQPGGRTVVPETSVAITVGNADVRYAHLVEYGTQKANAQPFFWPSVRLHQKRANASIKNAIRRAVKKEWGK